MEVQIPIIHLKFSHRQMEFDIHGFFELPCFHFSSCLNIMLVCVCVCVCVGGGGGRGSCQTLDPRRSDLSLLSPVTCFF